MGTFGTFSGLAGDYMLRNGISYFSHGRSRLRYVNPRSLIFFVSVAVILVQGWRI